MFFPSLNVCLLSQRKKKNSVYFNAAALNAAMLNWGSQSLEWNPGPQVRQPTVSRIALGKAETRTSCQDWEHGRGSWEDISSEMLQWNLSSRSGVRAAAKPSLSIWASQLEILQWKQTAHFCCVKVLKCVCESLCMCESEFWDERNKRRSVTQLSSLSLSFYPTAQWAAHTFIDKTQGQII